ncbi:SH3 domain-containing protein [Serratia nevei]|uniref:SH3 domain-containing protein n=1 Tax=Serratia nevei TaxID=2703794 RepID=UPI003F7D504B
MQKPGARTTLGYNYFEREDIHMGNKRKDTVTGGVIILLVIIGFLFHASERKQSAVIAPYSTNVSDTSSQTHPAAPVYSATATENPSVEKFVNTDKLNVRASPSGKVIGSVIRGEKITVYQEKADWIRISQKTEKPRWISAKSLCDYAECYIKPTITKAIKAPAKQTLPIKKPPQNSSIGSCPCSSGNICIGPRGGRYCITSGGNKRYGV